LLYPLSYEGGARLDPRSSPTRLPILAGGWLALLAGLGQINAEERATFTKKRIQRTVFPTGKDAQAGCTTGCAECGGRSRAAFG
jgi:hypothetical protein